VAFAVACTSSFCIAAGTLNRNTNSVAVPFVHGDGHTAMAFNSQGHVQFQTTEVMMRNGKKLIELAQEVRRRLMDAPSAPSLGRH